VFIGHRPEAVADAEGFGGQPAGRFSVIRARRLSSLS
jgi:hypothetical protein